MTSKIVIGRWYPEQAPGLPDETDDEYTNRLTGADGTDRRPYDHRRFRQCSIGYHGECSRWRSDNVGECECPCHEDPYMLDRSLRGTEAIGLEPFTAVRHAAIAAFGEMVVSDDDLADFCILLTESGYTVTPVSHG